MLRSELKLLFRRRRTLALLAGLAVLPVIVAVAIKLAGPASGAGHGPPFIELVTRNGFFTTLVGLSIVIPFFLPLTVAVVSGDSIAGEANSGTLRYLLTRPVGRTRVVIAKFIASMVFAVTATVTVVVVSFATGAALFGAGDVTLLSGTEISLGDAAARALLAALLVAVGTAGLAAIGLFVSTLTEQPVGAMAAITVAAIVSQILGSISQLEILHDALFSRHWLSFIDLFRNPVNFDAILDGVLLQLAWVAVFLTAAWARFTTKDVLA